MEYEITAFMKQIKGKAVQSCKEGNRKLRLRNLHSIKGSCFFEGFGQEIPFKVNRFDFVQTYVAVDCILALVSYE